MANVTLICTIRNEKETIADLLESMNRQTRLPDEIIIVDGGSSDGTIEKVKDYCSRLPIKLIVSPYANIAEGRNIAVRNASYDVVACTDGGCVLDAKWFENIVKPLENDLTVDVVSGIYLPLPQNEFEETAAYLVFPELETLDSHDILPSGRSVAFRKGVWNEVGGYPENLKTAEDTLFDLRLKRIGAKFFLAKDAKVFWRIRSDLKGIFKQFYNYAKGEGFARLFPLRYLFRYVILALLFVLLLTQSSSAFFWLFASVFLLAAFWVKHLRKVKRFSAKRILTALCIAMTIELGTTLGFAAGFFRSFSPNNKMKTTT